MINIYKSLLSKKNKYSILIEYIIVFLLLFIFYFSGYSLVCQIYNINNFDTQNFIAWDYSAYKGAVIYKDLLFYYGPLYFFRSTIPLVAIIYGLITPLTLTALYILFRNIFKNKLLSIITLVAVALNVSLFIGEGSWNRNGTGAVVVSIMSYIFSKKYFKYNITHFINGLLIGLLFSLIHDQGAYVIVICFILIILREPLLKGVKTIFSLKYYINTFKNVFTLFTGFCFGIAPFLIYLFYNNALSSFVYSLKEVSYVSIFTKIPFLPYVSSQENILIFTVLTLSIAILIIIFLSNNVKRYPNIYFVQLSLTLFILILEQKNILRTMGQQLVIFCLILLILLFAYINQYLNNKSIYKYYIYYLFICLIASFFIFIKPFSLRILLKNINNRIKSDLVYELRIINHNQEMQQCRNDSFKINNLPITQDYKEIYKYLKGQKDFNGKIFSFPSDPLFYVMFDQIVPPYSTTYEASRLSSQQINIEYIKDSNVQYVIYNTIGTDVDGVPVILRGNEIFRYIINNYDFHKIIGTFIVLKKSDVSDIFSQFDNKELIPIINKLLTVDLQNIPYTEGIYKYNTLKDNKDNKELYSGSISEISTYLKHKSIESESTLLIVEDISDAKPANDNVVLTLTIKSGLTTTISFKNCENQSPCILNIQNIPLFFKNRDIVEIKSPNSDLQIKILKINKDNELW